MSRFGPQGGRGGRSGFRRDRKLDRMSSVAVAADWQQIEEFDLQQLLKLQANPPQIDDLLWCGHLDQYDESYDKVTVRATKALKRIDNRVFYAVTTAEDPILERFAVEEVGNVFATDAILSQLMAAPRSLYSWDIVIQKTAGVIYLDKRENTIFDYLTVSETAHDPPVASEETDEINYPEKLSLEATMINQNFSQQVLMEPTESTRKTVSSFLFSKYCFWLTKITNSNLPSFPTGTHNNSLSPIPSLKMMVLNSSPPLWLTDTASLI
jgi:translation initiation factor 3 subunit D